MKFKKIIIKWMIKNFMNLNKLNNFLKFNKKIDLLQLLQSNKDESYYL